MENKSINNEKEIEQQNVNNIDLFPLLLLLATSFTPPICGSGLPAKTQHPTTLNFNFNFNVTANTNEDKKGKCKCEKN